MVTVKAVVEALLFASQKPLSVDDIAAAISSAAQYLEDGSDTGLPKPGMAEITECLQDLQSEYDKEGRSFQLIERVSGWVLASRSEYQIWVRQLFPDMRPPRLSAPALETLAIIAYRQPITKADVEAIRGVTVDGVMQKLLDSGLVKISGRADVPGRPLVYVTTQHFMEHFGLKHLDELPNVSELRQMPLPKAMPAAEAQPDANIERNVPATSELETNENGEGKVIAARDPQAD
ncbi:MAG TPA: SMC-Scp complex subunit ScpB [Chthoniobacterales bacterium]|jgi:segregation and condensation protein B|nr:SMC-Scp complex subunit ScpB [Chthoniobacterales bacterium]